MLTELSNQEYKNIQPLIGKLSHFLILQTVIEGKTPGKIWVDAPNAPTVTLVWDQLNTLFFLLGHPEDPEIVQQLNMLIKEEIFPEINELQYNRFFLQFGADKTWEPHKAAVLDRITWDEKTIYAYTRSPQNQAPSSQSLPISLPAEYHLMPITKELLKRTKLENLKFVRSAIRACWKSIEQYQDNGGIGYCVMRDNTIAAWCATDYIVGERCELYVETFDGFKQQGLGTQVAAACIEECLAQGYTVHWHCFNYATGSYKIAEKNHLVRIAERSVYVKNL